jgi:VIT1/CCC1 family predicted Fe2+/Mn2+ transporter
MTERRPEGFVRGIGMLGGHAHPEECEVVARFSEALAARPVQAALASAATFAIGASIPLAVAALTALENLVVVVSIASLACLAALGAISAKTGGAPVMRATLRVCFWGALAMVLTAGIGRLFGAVV